MLMFCSLYVFDPFSYYSIIPFQPFSLLGCMYFFALFDQITYFWYIVGKSTPFSIILEFLVSWNSPILEGMLPFLLSLCTQYSSSMYIERYRTIPILMSLFLCNMLIFVCVLICSISSCSPFPFFLTVDTPSVPMIPLTSLCTQFLFLPLEV